MKNPKEFILIFFKLYVKQKTGLSLYIINLKNNKSYLMILNLNAIVITLRLRKCI